MLRQLQLLNRTNVRFLATEAVVKQKPKVTFDPQVLQDLEDGRFKPRHHPGVVKHTNYEIPERIRKAILRATGDFPIKSLEADGKALDRYLRARHKPLEYEELEEKRRDLMNKINQEFAINEASNVDDKRLEQAKANKLKNILTQQVYRWQPMKYDVVKSLSYAFGRSDFEYATLVHILEEIKSRNPNFKPNSVFDYGSGVGTSVWASSSLWLNSIYEYYLVDISKEMNDLADLILRDGDENKSHAIQGVYHRQFLPSAGNLYDLVISAFSLFELPNAEARLQTVANLWQKTDNYLVLVENGTRSGFSIINEARDFILQKYENEATVFSPCPHSMICPRYIENDGTPCNFEVSYKKLSFGAGSPDLNKGLFSYVVLQKQTQDESNEEDVHWPRLVRPTLVRSKHSICRMCTNQGKLKEVIFTASKQGKIPYWCARSSQWGDRLPIVDLNES